MFHPKYIMEIQLSLEQIETTGKGVADAQGSSSEKGIVACTMVAARMPLYKMSPAPLLHTTENLDILSTTRLYAAIGWCKASGFHLHF